MLRPFLYGAPMGTALLSPAVARENTFILAHNRSLVANWEMYTDDSYIGADVGCMETLIWVDANMALAR